MLNTVEGDIFQTDCDIIVCQVNCVGILNYGIGIFIKSLFPHVYSEYRKICATSSPDNNLLGRTYMFDIEEDRQMALVFCQDGMNYRQGRFTDYEAFDKCMRFLHDNYGDKRIAFPYRFACKPYDTKSKDWYYIGRYLEQVLVDDGVDVTIYMSPEDIEFEARQQKKREKKQEIQQKILENRIKQEMERKKAQEEFEAEEAKRKAKREREESEP